VEYKATYENRIFPPSGEETLSWADYVNDMLQSDESAGDDSDAALLQPNIRRSTGRLKTNEFATRLKIFPLGRSSVAAVVEKVILEDAELSSSCHLGTSAK
jgi:hypothetical protein